MQHLLGVFAEAPDLPLHHYISATLMDAAYFEDSLLQHIAGRAAVAGPLTLQAASC